jgi:UDP-GlcNAc:undecaprenyl-phosphate/decaprenyl-phosphate GlcNAc-1-phosphate transferase
MLIFAVAFVTSALVCLLILSSAGWHLPFTADHPGISPQKFHTRAVPRVGGLGVMTGIVVAGIALDFMKLETEFYWLLVLSLMPAFFGGFAEDITRRVGPMTRLLLTVITAAAAYSLVGVRLFRSDVEWLDTALAFAPFGYFSMLLAVAGVAHAMNIIDGYNGLCGGVGVIALSALGIVAAMSNDTLVATFCFVTAAAGGGFLLFNYPSGRLFLGDGGAYTIGCVLALMAALLVQRNPEVSPWFPFVLVVYPIWETLFSIIRRVVVYRTRIGDPDARHMHSLVYRRVARRWVLGRRKGDKVVRNALTTVPFWVMSALLAAFAVTWSHDTQALELLSTAFIVGYCLIYWRLARLPVPTAQSLGERLRARAIERDPFNDTGPQAAK